MTEQKRINATDRTFFQELAEIIFSNPFSFDSTRLGSLSGVDVSMKDRDDRHQYAAVIPALTQRLEALARRGVTTIQSAHPNDQELLEYVYLFLTYSRFTDDFDDLIEQQVTLGSEPAPAPFARELLKQLEGYGFNLESAHQYLALFYQFRRAFFFIHQGLLGKSASMEKLRHSLWNNVFTRDVRRYARHLWNRREDFSTLLLGETGTGKGSAAAAIGRSGLIPYDARKGNFKYSFMTTFVAINLSQYPESLIESELFGHRKGAFTGAIDHHHGLFERCNPHGSLFLDEIGDVSVPTQIKLLNVLQERRFTPVGSHDALRFDGRVIAATNRPIDELRQQGKFREDFYFRLTSDVIEVPSLRQRLQESPFELEELVNALLHRIVQSDADALTDSVMHSMNASLPKDYAWPGNVRELEQAIRRILVTGAYSGEVRKPRPETSWIQKASVGALSAQEVLMNYCFMLYKLHGTYEEVAKQAQLDRRTATRYIKMYIERNEPVESELI